VGKPAATVMTSSPFLIADFPSFGLVSVLNANKLAEDPELVVKTFFTPRKFASFLSKASLKRPVVNQPSRQASTMLIISFVPRALPDAGMVVSPGKNG